MLVDVYSLSIFVVLGVKPKALWMPDKLLFITELHL